MAFGWNHEEHQEHKEEIFLFFVLLVSFVVPSLTSRSGEQALNVYLSTKEVVAKGPEKRGGL